MQNIIIAPFLNKYVDNTNDNIKLTNFQKSLSFLLKLEQNKFYYQLQQEINIFNTNNSAIDYLIINNKTVIIGTMRDITVFIFNEVYKNFNVKEYTKEILEQHIDNFTINDLKDRLFKKGFQQFEKYLLETDNRPKLHKL